VSNIVRLILEGKLRQTDLIKWGDKEWQPLKDSPLKGLFPPIGPTYVEPAAESGFVIGLLVMGLVGIPLFLVLGHHVGIVRAALASVTFAVCTCVSYLWLVNSYSSPHMDAVPVTGLIIAISAYSLTMGLLVGDADFFLLFLLGTGGVAGAAAGALSGAVVGLIKHRVPCVSPWLKRVTKERWMKRALEWADTGRRASLRHAYLPSADLAGADLQGADLADADLQGADLADANLQNAILKRADLAGANLAGAILISLQARDPWDYPVRLQCANLEHADLQDADLARANLCDADLKGANMSNANLKYSDLRNANLLDANLWGTDLRGANLEHANLRGARYNDATIWPEGFAPPPEAHKVEVEEE
jgi:hypothetical protein